MNEDKPEAKAKLNSNDILTDKQKMFCEEYLVDFNGAQAAIRAGYSEKTARFIASENLTKPNVQAYLSKLMADRVKRVKIDQDDVLRELQHIAFDDIKNYLSFRTEKTLVGEDENGKPIYAYCPIVEIKDSKTIDTRNVQEVSLGKNGAFKFKLYDKEQALNMIGRHMGMFTDNVNFKGEGEGIKEIKISFVDKSKRNSGQEQDPKIVGDYTKSIDAIED